MNRNDFVKEYSKTLNRALAFSEKARREGLLALEDELVDEDKINERDIFEYGLRFVVDGTDREIIEKILTNIINQEKDEYSRLLKTIQKEAVLMLQEGTNRRIMFHVLNSYTDMPLENDETGKPDDIT